MMMFAGSWPIKRNMSFRSLYKLHSISFRQPPLFPHPLARQAIPKTPKFIISHTTFEHFQRPQTIQPTPLTRRSCPFTSDLINLAVLVTLIPSPFLFYPDVRYSPDDADAMEHDSILGLR